MERLYIKFFDPKDIYKIDPHWQGDPDRSALSLDQPCPKCGNPIHVWVKLRPGTMLSFYQEGPEPAIEHPTTNDDGKFERVVLYVWKPSDPVYTVELPDGIELPVQHIHSEKVPCIVCFPVTFSILDDCQPVLLDCVNLGGLTDVD